MAYKHSDSDSDSDISLSSLKRKREDSPSTGGRSKRSKKVISYALSDDDDDDFASNDDASEASNNFWDDSPKPKTKKNVATKSKTSAKKKLPPKKTSAAKKTTTAKNSVKKKKITKIFDSDSGSDSDIQEISSGEEATPTPKKKGAAKKAPIKKPSTPQTPIRKPTISKPSTSTGKPKLSAISKLLAKANIKQKGDDCDDIDTEKKPKKEVEKEKENVIDDSSAETPAETDTPTTAKKRGAPKKKTVTGPPLSEIPLKLSGNLSETFIMQTSNSDMDMSGDTGSVGRVFVNSEKEDPLTLDLKGYMLEGRLYPCTTFLVVNVGPAEAKVESAINTFFQPSNESTVMQEAETVTKGSVNFSDDDSDYIGDDDDDDDDDEKDKNKKELKMLNSEDLVKVRKKATKKTKRKPAKKKTKK